MARASRVGCQRTGATPGRAPRGRCQCSAAPAEGDLPDTPPFRLVRSGGCRAPRLAARHAPAGAPMLSPSLKHLPASFFGISSKLFVCVHPGASTAAKDWWQSRRQSPQCRPSHRIRNVAHVPRGGWAPPPLPARPRRAAAACAGGSRGRGPPADGSDPSRDPPACLRPHPARALPYVPCPSILAPPIPSPSAPSDWAVLMAARRRARNHLEPPPAPPAHSRGGAPESLFLSEDANGRHLGRGRFRRRHRRQSSPGTAADCPQRTPWSAP